MTTGTATSIPTSFARRTPPDFRAAHPARLPCGAKPARPLADRAASFARRVASKPGQALQASRHSPVGPPPFGTADTSPAGLAPPPIGQSHPMSGTKLSLLRTSNAQPGQNSPHTPQNGDTKPFLACRENFVPLKPPTSRAGRTLYRTPDHLRYETLPTRNPGRPNRYKTLPADGPNGPTRYKTLPTHHKTAIPSHFSLAGRTISRLRQRQAEQGELCTAHRTTCGTKLSPLNSSAEATGQNSPRSS